MTYRGTGSDVEVRFYGRHDCDLISLDNFLMGPSQGIVVLRRRNYTNGRSWSSVCCLYYGWFRAAVTCALIHSTERSSQPRYARSTLWTSTLIICKYCSCSVKQSVLFYYGCEVILCFTCFSSKLWMVQIQFFEIFLYNQYKESGCAANDRFLCDIILV